MIPLTNHHSSDVTLRYIEVIIIHADNMKVSKNAGTPKSSIFVVFPIINHPFWGTPL